MDKVTPALTWCVKGVHHHIGCKWCCNALSHTLPIGTDTVIGKDSKHGCFGQLRGATLHSGIYSVCGYKNFLFLDQYVFDLNKHDNLLIYFFLGYCLTVSKSLVHVIGKWIQPYIKVGPQVLPVLLMRGKWFHVYIGVLEILVHPLCSAVPLFVDPSLIATLRRCVTPGFL